VERKGMLRFQDGKVTCAANMPVLGNKLDCAAVLEAARKAH
jgi:hypothetical protein